MNKLLFMPALCACLAYIPSTSAQSDAGVTACAKRSDMVKRLEENFKQLPVLQAQVNTSVVLEAFVSENGSWTMFASDTSGQACVLSMGGSWEYLSPPADGIKN